MIYGRNAEAMTKALLDAYSLSTAIRNKDRIILKPNLVIPARPDDGATTHMGIIKAVIEYLIDSGKKNITIAESSWVGASTDAAFRLNGYPEIAKRYGITLTDIKKCRYRTVEYDGLKMEIAEDVLNADYLINLPVLKGHCQTKVTCAMKNLKGCLSDKSKREFHRLGLMRPIAALNMILRPSLNIVDSLSGDLDFEEGGNPVETDRMMLSESSLALDILGSSLMGYSKHDIGYITKMEEYLGKSLLLEDIEIKELNKPERGSVKPKGTVARLSRYTDADDACSACYASLIHALKRLDEEGLLYKLNGKKIACGQGWKGKHTTFGSGACCMNAEHFVKGCPPTASNILTMLEEAIND